MIAINKNLKNITSSCVPEHQSLSCIVRIVNGFNVHDRDAAAAAAVAMALHNGECRMVWKMMDDRRSMLGF